MLQLPSGENEPVRKMGPRTVLMALEEAFSSDIGDEVFQLRRSA